MKAKGKTGKQPQPRALRIQFHNEHAQAVSIAGTFNDWPAGRSADDSLWQAIRIRTEEKGDQAI